MRLSFTPLIRRLGISLLCCATVTLPLAARAQGTASGQTAKPSAIVRPPAVQSQTNTPLEFAAVVPDRPLVFPRDMGAHPDYRTEWWYATGWLQKPDGTPLGFQITFFRSATDYDRANPSAFAPTQLIIAHAALSDPSIGHLVHDQRIARQGFDLAYARSGDTNVKLDTWHMTRDVDGSYRVDVEAQALSLHLRLTPSQTLMQQGQNGYSQKGPHPSEASYYYSEPQLRVSGYVSAAPAPSAAAEPHTVASDTATDHGTAARNRKPTALLNVPVTGRAWLDHEWSTTVLNPKAVGWDWLGANMNDGAALMAFAIRGKDGRAIWAHAALRESSGAVQNFGPATVAFVPQRYWRSPRTDIRYPVAQQLRTGAVEWELTPLFDDQELDSTQSTGAVYWEGAVRINRNGQQIGQGYLELTGYGKRMVLK